MKKTLGILLLASIVLLFAGCLLIPAHNTSETLPPAQLADPDSRFLRLRGLQLHYKAQGEGEPFFLLLHGFGASVYSWRDVMEPLAAQGSVLAYDRPAFGLTERPLDWTNWNPYSSSAQVDIALELMDKSEVDKAILVGNSAGGIVAAQVALQAPDRVEALILISPSIYQSRRRPGVLQFLMQLPFVENFAIRFLRSSFPKAGELLAQEAWHDKTKYRPEIRAGYELPLRAENWDRGLWYYVLANEGHEGLVDSLKQSRVPILIVSGDDDRIVPTASSIRLAEEINTELKLLKACGHVPQEECPDQLMAEINAFLEKLTPDN